VAAPARPAAPSLSAAPAEAVPAEAGLPAGAPAAAWPAAEAPSHHGEPHHAARHLDLAAERALLADARAAMQAADAPRALAILDEHARRFAHGQLAEERDAMRVAALWLAGDHEGARARAGEFARRHPDSLFLPSVQRAVQ
jgi:hypothetical protein